MVKKYIVHTITGHGINRPGDLQMNFLIDDIDNLTSNCIELAQEPGQDKKWYDHDWYTMYRSGVNYDGKRLVSWDDVDTGDITANYILEVKKNISWWCGLTEDGPQENLIKALPEKVLSAIRDKKIFLCILGDMDYFPQPITISHLQSIHDAMIEMNLPAGSVWIGVNDSKLDDLYQPFVRKNGKYFLMTYSNSNDDFTNCPKTPAIEKASKMTIARDFNSLNMRATHRQHTSYHLFTLLKSNFLKRGLVSLIDFKPEDLDDMRAYIRDKDNEIFDQVMTKYYPRLCDADHIEASEEELPMSVYHTSLMTVVCETTDQRPNWFGTKTMKPIKGGHPFIIFGGKGTLAQLRDLGYRTELCGIDTSYDNIIDNEERAAAAAEELDKWIKLPRAEKLKRIEESLEDIKFNMNKVSLSQRTMDEMVKASRKYFK